MSESPGQKFLIRDNHGNVYGPADAAMLVEWVQQGRIVAGMSIAPRETREWTEVSQHPLLAEVLQRRAEELRHVTPDPYAVEPTPVNTPTDEDPQPSAPTTYDVTPSPSEYAQTVSASPGPLATQGPTDLQYDSLPPRQNGLGVTGFVFGLVSIVCTFISCVPICGCLASPIAGLSALVAIVLSSIALFQINAQPTVYVGRGLPMTGLILGIATIVLFIVGIVFAVAFNAMPPAPGRP